MKVFITCAALFLGQYKTLKDAPPVHLHGGQTYIPVEFGGKVVELVNDPPVIHLPNVPPQPDSYGVPWAVDVKNAEAGTVTVYGNMQFRVNINVGRSVHIKSTGTGYSVDR